MASNPIPWRSRGSFIPFPKPVSPPVAQITDTPLVSLCVNEEWMSYILGCCKSLMRPETWDADDSSINATVLQAMGIPGLIQVGCAGGVQPAFCAYNLVDSNNNFGLDDYMAIGWDSNWGAWAAGGWYGTESKNAGTGAHVNAIAIHAFFDSPVILNSIGITGFLRYGDSTICDDPFEIIGWYGGSIVQRQNICPTSIPEGNYGHVFLFPDTTCDEISIQADSYMSYNPVATDLGEVTLTTVTLGAKSDHGCPTFSPT